MAEAKKRILVVDDEPDARTFLTTVLEDNGYETQEVADGEEAVRAIEENPPDLITLDITMPEKSGVSVYRRVKESDNYKHIPVIIVTTEGRDVDKERGLRLGADRYLIKPFEPVKLQQFVQDLLDL